MDNEEYQEELKKLILMPLKRTDNDIDSIEIGTPSKGGFKIYYNSKSDTQNEVTIRIDNAISYINYAKSKMQIDTPLSKVKEAFA